MKLPNIVQATASYEKWTAKHLKIIQAELDLKHQHMAEEAFPFFRATFYRWAQLWPVICPEFVKGPQVLAIGDLHIENFGTWRDSEGRLIWGINDFDEAWQAPYSLDLVRLLASCIFAIETENLSVTPKKACDALEHGYRDGIAQGGSPFVLAEDHQWLRLLCMSDLRDPVRFWKKKMAGLPKFDGDLPADVKKDLHQTMPEKNMSVELRSRIAGLGSLGHPRIVALGTWHDAHVAREAKRLVPSASIWANNLNTSELMCKKLIESAVRVLDPHVNFTVHWAIRRLAPDCSHIDMQTLPKKRDEEKLLYYMGFETANIHLGSQKAIAGVKKDLGFQKDRWIFGPAKAMTKATFADWKEWRRHYQTSQKKKK